MKLKGINFFSLILGLLFFVACSEEEELSNKNKEKDGLPTNVSFAIKNTDAEYITTKADANAWSGIKDLYILTFNAQGVCDGGGYFEADEEGVLPVLNINSWTGTHTVYAYANVTDTHLTDIYSTLENIKSNSGSVNDLASLNTQLKENKLDVVSNYVQMTGFCADSENAAKAGTVKTVTFTESPSSFTIYLMRVISVITFDINPNKGITFIPTSYKVGNVPTTATLAVGQDNLPASVFDSNLLQNFINDNGDYSFQFTMLENKNNTIQGNINSAKDREERCDHNAPVNESNPFTKAPLNSTYVALTGHYTGPGRDGNVDADVTYYIHLGNTTGNNWGEFKTARNTNYTYNVNINGVDDIYVEVESSSQPDDRVDGTIVTGGQTHTVDCHYDAVVIKLSADTKYKFVYDGQSDGLAPWIKLYYNDGKKTLVTYTETDGTDLITTAEQLNEKLASLSKEAYFVCFVDENYGNDSNWRSFVNKPNRQFKILPESSGELINGSTIVDGKGIILSQRSIQTFYNVERGSGTAYGVEWINESGNVQYSRNSPGNHANKNGYNNMTAEINGKTWTNVYSENYAYIACMKRNRDENRNGEIDEDEIKWYLPSLDQLTGLWVGAPILGDARLYTGAAGSVTQELYNYHYWSSTSSNTDNKYYLWAEEGSSFGDDSYRAEKPIRCVRSLGSKNNFDNYYVYDHDRRIFTLNTLEEDAVRAKVSGELVKHNELDPANRLSRSFEVASQNTSKGEPYYKWTTENSRIDRNQKSACDNYNENGNGWRLPNQRELSLMNREELLDAGEFGEFFGWKYTINYMSRTYFSTPSHRYGYGQGTKQSDKSPYMRLYKKKILDQDNADYGVRYAAFKIRCVRDK